MNYKIVFLTKYKDKIHNSRMDNILLEFRIANAFFEIFQENDFYVIKFIRKANEDEEIKEELFYTKNTDFWVATNLTRLQAQLIELLGNSVNIILAIHWGGKSLIEAEEYTNDFVDSKNQLINGSVYLTYYSENEDYISSINDLRAALLKIKGRITDILRNKLIELWLPLAIDMQGLKDYKGEHLSEYFSAIQDDVIAMMKRDEYKEWLTWEQDGIFKEIKKPGYPYEILNKISEESDARKFYTDYLGAVESFPLWFDNAVRKLNAKMSPQ